MSAAVPGSLRVSNDCIADLAGYAALECYGVVGMAEVDAEVDAEAGVWRLLPVFRLRKGIDVSVEGGRVVVELHVIIEQGVNMASVADNLTSAVRFLLKRIAELEGVDVKVHIVGMRESR